MLELHVFQLLGLIYFIIALGMMISPGFYKKMLNSFAECPMAVYLAGIMTLVVGYLLVTFFNVWAWEWSLVITVIGWLALLKGVVLFLFPSFVIKMSGRLQKNFRTMAIIPLVIGIGLLILGFCNL